MVLHKVYFIPPALQISLQKHILPPKSFLKLELSGQLHRNLQLVADRNMVGIFKCSGV